MFGLTVRSGVSIFASLSKNMLTEKSTQTV